MEKTELEENRKSTRWNLEGKDWLLGNENSKDSNGPSSRKFERFNRVNYWSFDHSISRHLIFGLFCLHFPQTKLINESKINKILSLILFHSCLFNFDDFDEKTSFFFLSGKFLSINFPTSDSIHKRSQRKAFIFYKYLLKITLKPLYNPQIRTNFWRQYPGWIIKRVDDIKGGLG